MHSRELAMTLLLTLGGCAQSASVDTIRNDPGAHTRARTSANEPRAVALATAPNTPTRAGAVHATPTHEPSAALAAPPATAPTARTSRRARVAGQRAAQGVASPAAPARSATEQPPRVAEDSAPPASALPPDAAGVEPAIEEVEHCRARVCPRWKGAAAVNTAARVRTRKAP
jgi:hypothetical protein